MKHPSSIILTALAAISLAASCGSSDSPMPEVEAAARRDAAKVVAATGSMQREGAVLDIRVREQALRDAGHGRAADIYISTAVHILIDSLGIIDPDPVLTDVNYASGE